MNGYYRYLIVESYYSYGEQSRHHIRVRPLPGQGFPIGMNVECSKRMRASHPVGTKFKIQAKIKRKEGGPEFLYTSYKWPYEVMSDKEADIFIGKSAT